MTRFEGAPSRHQTLFQRRDFYAGALVSLAGVFTIVQGRTYTIGSLTNMGPGFFPVVLGSVLLVVGTLIAANRANADQLAIGEEHLAPIDWRGCSFIILGVVAFIVLGAYAGMVMASMACVFISALGDRQATFKSSFLLALGVTAFGVLLFFYILKIPFPLFWW